MAQLASRLFTGLFPVTSLPVPDRDQRYLGLVTPQHHSDWETVGSRATVLVLEILCCLHEGQGSPS